MVFGMSRQQAIGLMGAALIGSSIGIGYGKPGQTGIVIGKDTSNKSITTKSRVLDGLRASYFPNEVDISLVGQGEPVALIFANSYFRKSEEFFPHLVMAAKNNGFSSVGFLTLPSVREATLRNPDSPVFINILGFNFPAFSYGNPVLESRRREVGYAVSRAARCMVEGSFENLTNFRDFYDKIYRKHSHAGLPMALDEHFRSEGAFSGFLKDLRTYQRALTKDCVSFAGERVVEKVNTSNGKGGLLLISTSADDLSAYLKDKIPDKSHLLMKVKD